MTLYFGPPSYFITINPADMDSHLLLRLSYIGGNPAIGAEIPSVTIRKKLVAEDPVLSAWSYENTIQDVMRIIHGIDIGSVSRENLPDPEKRQMTALGRTMLSLVSPTGFKTPYKGSQLEPFQKRFKRYHISANRLRDGSTCPIFAQRQRRVSDSAAQPDCELFEVLLESSNREQDSCCSGVEDHSEIARMLRTRSGLPSNTQQPF